MKGPTPGRPRLEAWTPGRWLEAFVAATGLSPDARLGTSDPVIEAIGRGHAAPGDPPPSRPAGTDDGR